MLIDTSAWAEYFEPIPKKPTASKVNVAIKHIIDTHVLSNQLIYTCPIIVQEVLQGSINQKEQNKLTSALRSLELLTLEDQFTMAQQAAEIYLKCRIKGITVRKSIDCLIAHFALHFNQPLLHKDRDFDHIAKVFPLKIVPIVFLPNP